MRNALSILVVGGLLSIISVDAAQAGEGVPSPSVYAMPVAGQTVVPQDDEQGLLPSSYNGLQQVPMVSQNGRQSGAPQASIVEAIPTPTAFHAGGFLLLLIFVGRFFRKLRWA